MVCRSATICRPPSPKAYRLELRSPKTIPATRTTRKYGQLIFVSVMSGSLAGFQSRSGARMPQAEKKKSKSGHRGCQRNQVAGYFPAGSEDDTVSEKKRLSKVDAVHDTKHGEEGEFSASA